MLASCAKSPDQAKVTAEGGKIMTFVEWENIKDGCEIEGTEVLTRLGPEGQWRKKAQLWDKECVKKGMKEKGYAKAVVFDPDELSEFKKNVCELYDQTTVVMDGKHSKENMEQLMRSLKLENRSTQPLDNLSGLNFGS